MKINEMIIAGRGTSFDPALVDEFVKIGDKIKNVLLQRKTISTTNVILCMKVR